VITVDLKSKTWFSKTWFSKTWFSKTWFSKHDFRKHDFQKHGVAERGKTMTITTNLVQRTRFWFTHVKASITVVISTATYVILIFIFAYPSIRIFLTKASCLENTSLWMANNINKHKNDHHACHCLIFGKRTYNCGWLQITTGKYNNVPGTIEMLHLQEKSDKNNMNNSRKYWRKKLSKHNSIILQTDFLKRKLEKKKKKERERERMYPQHDTAIFFLFIFFFSFFGPKAITSLERL